jgi:hypothetical protein
MDELKTILIQTGHNIDRMFEDNAINESAYLVLKQRNELALKELGKLLKQSNHD